MRRRSDETIAARFMMLRWNRVAAQIEEAVF